MPDDRLFAVTAAGCRIGFPLSAVKAVGPWKTPLPFPCAASWIAGVLPGEGEAWPVLRESFWAADAGIPEACHRSEAVGGGSYRVYVFLSHGGRILALPGSDPGIVSLPREGAQGSEDELASGSFDEAGAPGARIRVEALYSMLGLDYNEAPLG